MDPTTRGTSFEKAEMHMLLTHSSNPTIWLEECAAFYSHLRNRGYPSRAINATFRKVNWNQRSKMLEPRKREQDDDKFFAQYRACVRNAPGVRSCGPGWTSRSRSCSREQGQRRDIFPPRAFFALRSALPMVHILPR
jgi:hypothetical protein